MSPDETMQLHFERAEDSRNAEWDSAYAVVGEMLEYFESHHLATWAPLAAIIVREREKARAECGPFPPAHLNIRAQATATPSPSDVPAVSG